MNAKRHGVWSSSLPRELDRMLDTVRSEPPSPALTARVLRAAPLPRRAHRWRRVVLAAAPLAAAAGLALWLASGHQPESRVADLTSMEVGEYASPTDVLLDAYGVDISATVPRIGCSDSTLGCPDMEAPTEPYSERPAPQRYLV
jgi:hypothetical protein